MEVAMAEDEDSDADGEGKAHTFSAENLAAVAALLPARSQEFDDGEVERLLRIWLEWHCDAAVRADEREKEKRGRRLAARKQWRAEFDSLLEGLQKTVDATQALYQSGGVDKIIAELSLAHDDPSESIWQLRALERAGDELAAIYRGLDRFRKAALRARKDLSDPIGRPRGTSRML
jgi:hypothetical protein